VFASSRVTGAECRQNVLGASVEAAVARSTESRF